MKRTRDKQPAFTEFIADIKGKLSAEQLAGIGAVALAYNVVERHINDLFHVATYIDEPISIEVMSRINGIDGKIEIIKVGARHLGFSDKEQVSLAECLGKGVFGLYKTYRDAIVHASIINASVGIGVRIGSRASIDEVLLSTKALDAFYEHLVFLRDELEATLSLLITDRVLKERGQSDPKRAQPLEERPKRSARFLAYRTQRRSLPPIPEFPSESEMREAETRYQRERESSMLAYYLRQNPPPMFGRPTGSILATATDQGIEYLPQVPEKK